MYTPLYLECPSHILNLYDCHFCIIPFLHLSVCPALSAFFSCKTISHPLAKPLFLAQLRVGVEAENQAAPTFNYL